MSARCSSPPASPSIWLPAIHDGPRAVARARLLIEGARRLGLPILVSEHYPQGLGPTVPEIREAAGSETPTLPKVTFSCLRDSALAGGPAGGLRIPCLRAADLARPRRPRL